MKSGLKIAIFNYGSSGLWHYAASLANAVAQQPEVTEVRVYTSKYNNLDLLQTSAKLSCETIDLPHSLLGLAKYSWQERNHRQWRQSLTNFAPDVIHIMDTMPLYVWHYSLLKKYPVVFTQHDPVVHTGDPHALVLRWLQIYLQRLSRKVIVHGETLKTALLKAFKISPNKVVTVPLGEFSILLQPPHVNPAATQRQPNTVLFFGRLSWYKGLDILLASVKHLQQEGTAVRLLIVGPGDVSPYRASLGQLSHVEVVNRYVPDSEVATYFHQAEVIVLPYREGTQSSVISLALPAGVPIIATRVGALPEILEHEQNSLLVPPNDSQALAAAIKQLLGNEALCEKLRQGGYQTARTTLAWSTIAATHVRMYQDIV